MKKIERETGEYLFYCEKIRGMSGATLAMKRNVLRRFTEAARAKEVRKISNADIENWTAEELGRGVSAGAVNLYNSIVAAWLKYFQNNGVRLRVDLNLVRKVKNTGVRARKFYSGAEIAKVTTRADTETALMIRVMFETGMRIAELRKLSVSEISGRRINFIGKGRKPREAYLSAETARDLDRFIKGRVGYVWGLGSINGEPPTEHTLRKRMREAFLAAGHEGFYPHALRHSFATNLQLKGASVAEIKEMIGHSGIATTERYLHGFEGRLEELFDKYQR